MTDTDKTTRRSDADQATPSSADVLRCYELIAQHTTDMIWTIDLTQQEDLATELAEGDLLHVADKLLAQLPFTYASPASEKILGFTPQQMRTRTVKSLLTEESYAAARQLLTEELVAARGSSDSSDRDRTIELAHVCRDNSLRWCEVRGKTLRNEAGEVTALLGVTRDISERRQAEEILQDSSATLLQLFTHLPDFVLVVDREARIKFVNRGVPGVAADELIGSIGFAHIRPEYVPACQQALAAAFTTCRVQQVEARTIYDRWWDCRIVPLLEDEPSTTAMIICNDVTQHRSAEQWSRIQHQLSVRLSETSDLREALEASLDAVLEIPELDCGGIYLVDAPLGVKLEVHQGVSPTFIEAVTDFDNESNEARIVREGKPVYAGLQTIPAEIHGTCEREGLKSVGFVPICHEGRAIGCLNVASRHLDEVPKSVRTGLETTVSYIGAAIARIQADQSRLKSEARFRTLVENMPDTVMFTDLESRILYINHTHSEAAIDAIVGTSGLQYFSPDQHEEILRAHQLAIESRQVQPFDCNDRWGRRWLCRAVPRLDNGEPRGLMVITTDVTDKWLAEKELRESEERFRLIAENVSDVVWTLHIEGLHEFVTGISAETDVSRFDDLFERAEFTFFSPSVEQVLGYTVDEALRLKPLTLIAPSSHLVLRNGFLDTIASVQENPDYVGGREAVELEHMKRDGCRLWCEMTAKLLRDAQGRVIGLEGVTRDISERKSFEKELSAVITHEQQRMGQELHDELGQQLLGARLMSESLQKSLRLSQSPATQQACELHEALEKAQESVRELIKGIRPVEIDAEGLMAALDDLATSTQRLSGIHCSFAHSERVPVEDNHTATQLYYIAREAVQNAVKHASPRKITIGLAVTHGVLHLWVSDDGVGIRGRAGGSTGGMGLRIMRYRAGVIGAQLIIDAGKDGGTRITCSLEQVP